MPSGRPLIEFLTASILIILLPGPSVLFTVGRAIAYGKRAAVLTVLGNSLGALVLAVVVALGVGPLVQQSQWLLLTVQLVGATYLVYLGIQAWRSRSAHGDVQATAHLAKSTRSLVREGFTVGVLNPKTAVFFATVMPRFLDGASNAAQSLLLMGCAFVAMAFVSDSSYGLLAGHVRALFYSHPDSLTRLAAVGGVLITGLGCVLAAGTLVEILR
ncbi:MAG: LysE family translocator [Actinobacteria bacterium]|nr:LysE family translocator [Actinomycetota bacterium]